MAIAGLLSVPTKAAAVTSLSPPPEATSSESANSAPQPPQPLHLAAQQGDLQTLYRLLDHPQDRVVTASDPDDQGITPLHWAAINSHILFCKALLERGAEPDVRGGELGATPLMWAARQGHLAVVHLLIKYSADPSLVDSQQFNALHLAVHSSSAFLVAYLLFTMQPLAVDSTDPEGHTALAWACYQGDAISVELLLRAGADVLKTDNAGLTPLHWAVTKGNSTCIRRVVQAGADLIARTNDGKTAREMAIELKSLPAYERALQEAGLDPRDGRKEDLPFPNPRRANAAIFLVAFLAFGAIFETIALLPWYTSLILVGAEAYAMHHVVSRVILGVRPASTKKHSHGHGHSHSHGHGSERVTKSGYLCAVITASLAWVFYVWVSRFVLQLLGYAITSLLFALSFLSCCYNFFRAITLDPGTVRGPQGGTEELKEVIEDMVESGGFNGINFCLTCMVRRPLRSKHSFATDRCVAKFDHYCPWVWNDVGVNNHRQFLLFVASLVGGVILFTQLTWAYFYEKAPDLAPDAYCPALVPSLICTATTYDSFAFAVAFWAGLQLLWTVILLFAQLWQVARQMTTLEVSNVGRYGYMGGKPGITAASQFGAVDKFGAALPTTSGTSTPSSGSNDDPASLAHAPRPQKGTFDYLLKLLGLDRFTSRGKAISGLAHATRGDVVNPFDLGIRSNCVDFWTRGKELGVEYERLYEIPEAGGGGFRRVVAERKRREREEKQRGGSSTGPVSLGVGGGAGTPTGVKDVGLAGLLAGMKRKMRMGYGSNYDRVHQLDDVPV
ncbi:hypothetical protein JCM10908_001059 [Rhodotorula pacifica]|uniref:ankyrin repeat domain-containing DHHC palmitoyltransferase family protein n=1 Tax=Rhodotorula pacifica TaxID=1495444 RepID=UPI003173C2D7